MAIGFVGYAVWEFARAVLDRRNDGNDAKGLAKRAKCAVVGAIYVGLCGRRHLAGDGQRLGRQAATSRQRPPRSSSGRAASGSSASSASALLVYGVANVWKAKSQKFTKDLDDHKMNHGTRKWAIRSGVAGFAARGVVFAIVGVFLTKAAYEYDPKEAVGIDGALAKLAHQSWGHLAALRRRPRAARATGCSAWSRPATAGSDRHPSRPGDLPARAHPKGPWLTATAPSPFLHPTELSHPLVMIQR